MKKTVLLILIVLVSTTSLAADLSVPGQYATIQSAINAANYGDRVIVAQDTYYENINFNGKNITLTSTDPNDWSVISETIIDGGQSGSVVTFAGTEDANCILTGFTITNGQASDGGGILGNQTNAVINHCRIIDNRAGFQGGGLYDFDGRISNCKIASNQADFGGGLYGCDGTIINCTIIDNTALSYEGAGLSSCSGNISNCIIWGSQSPQLYGCSEPMYSCWPDGTTGTGNISQEPIFIDGASHLRQDSLCRDAGDPALDYSGQTDIDGQPRAMGAAVDIGYDEMTPKIILINNIGGEVWVSGSTHEIQWTNYTTSPTIDFLLSTDAGDNWDTVEASVANTGSYLWQLPGGADSNDCLIKILPTDEPLGIEYLNFNDTFTIHPTIPDTALASAWPTLGGNIARTGRSNNIGPELGSVKWQFTTNSPVHNSIAIGPKDQIHITCQNGRVYTLDPDGNELWHFDIGSSVVSSPTVGGDGTIYVSCDDGKIYAIDRDGELRWTHNTGDAVYSTPTVSDDGKVFVAGRNGIVYALDQIGSNLWSFELPGAGDVPDSIIAPPAIGIDGSIYVGGFYGSKLYSLSPENGAVNWSCDFQRLVDPGEPTSGLTHPGLVAAPVVADDGTIYASLIYDSNLYAIDPNDGSILWDAALEQDDDDLDSDGWSEPVVGSDGTIYVSLDNNFINAVNPDGTIKWTKQLSLIGGFTLTVGSNGLIYAASDDGSLYVLSTDGDELSRFDGSQWLSYPVIGPDGILYISDADRAVWAIDPITDETFDLHRPEDITTEGAVNLDDLVVLAGQWQLCSDRDLPPQICSYDGETLYMPADINRDQYINFGDLALFASRWLDNN